MSHLIRHVKFSSVGDQLTRQVAAGKLYKTDKRKITTVFIHCSASPQDRGDDVYTIDRWHTDRFKVRQGIGYHYVVLENGTIQKAAWVDYSGAGVGKGGNTGSIHICRIGGMGKDGKQIYDATPQQIKALKMLTRLLISDKMYKLLPEAIKGHNEYPDYAKRGCPLLTKDQMEEIRHG